MPIKLPGSQKASYSLSSKSFNGCVFKLRHASRKMLSPHQETTVRALSSGFSTYFPAEGVAMFQDDGRDGESIWLIGKQEADEASTAMICTLLANLVMSTM